MSHEGEMAEKRQAIIKALRRFQDARLRLKPNLVLTDGIVMEATKKRVRKGSPNYITPKGDVRMNWPFAYVVEIRRRKGRPWWKPLVAVTFPHGNPDDPVDVLLHDWKRKSLIEYLLMTVARIEPKNLNVRSSD